MNRKQTPIILMLGLLLAFSVAACSGAEKSTKPSADWSRGIALGADVAGSIGLLVEGDGEKVHMSWPYEDARGVQLAYVQLDRTATPIVNRDIVFPGHMRTPRLLPGVSGQVHLIWASRLQGEKGWKLWHVLLDEAGSPQGNPRLLLAEGDEAGKYVADSDHAGGVIIAWDQSSQKEIKALRIGPGGETLAGPAIVSGKGEDPSLRVDEAGKAHLAWRDDLAITYAMLGTDNLETIQEVRAVDLTVHTDISSLGDVLDGPTLGYASDWVYIFWSVTNTKDTDAGTSSIDFVAFPRTAPTSPDPVRIWTVPLEKQPYIPFDSGYALQEMTMPLGIAEAIEEFGRVVEYYHPLAKDWVWHEGAVSPHIMSPMTMHGQGDRLVVALSMTQEKRDGNETSQQIATAIFEKGVYLGYSVSSDTPNLSDDPVVMPDEDGDLYVAWREGSNGKQVYYATTTAAAQETLDRLTFGDVFQFVSIAGMEGFSSLILFPVLAPCWILPGLVLIGLWLYRGRSSSLREKINWVPLALGIGFFFLAKLVFLPTILTYTPFSAWGPVPGSLEAPLRILVPVLIFGIALAAAFKLRERISYSLIVFYLAIVLIDSLLTLSVYGVNFMGAV